MRAMKIITSYKHWVSLACLGTLVIFSQCETQDVKTSEPIITRTNQESDPEKIVIMADHDPLVEEKENMVVKLETKIENLEELIEIYKNDADLLDSSAKAHMDVTIAKLEKEKSKLKQKLKEVQNATNDNWPQTEKEAKERLELFENEILNFYTKN